ncbi:hypothetical protein CQA58_04525 [Helicobacter brantae]|uniref:Autotransporter domain-containing protein n=2 Tax=Helicobacter brantae TaxID=375927 RepID=A0A3D8J0B3_9HELI|nr:hypothetical protein CQA58_04525 [Helicobacter brantae]
MGGGGGLSWKTTDGFKQLVVNGIDSPYWIFSFGDTTNQAMDGSGGYYATNNGVLANGSALDSTFVFTSDSATMIGSSVQDRGRLKIQFLTGSVPTNWNDDASKKRKVLINFNSVTKYANGDNGVRNISFVGDLSIEAGVGENKNIVEGNFSGDMIGDVYIFANFSLGYNTAVNTTLNFKNNASLQGNIYSDSNIAKNREFAGAGNNTFNFQTGGIYGGLNSGTWYPEGMKTENVINFNAGETSPETEVVSFIDGDVVAQPGGVNIINFNRDNDARIGRLVSNSGENEDYYDYGKNIVNFSGDTLTIKRGIAVEGSENSNYAGNQINLKKANARLVIDSGGLIARQTRNLSNQDYPQLNEIIFKQGGSLILKGSSTNASDGSFSFDGMFARDRETNRITFEGTQNASIQAETEIRSESCGSNLITFQGNGINTIDSFINASGGSNSVVILGDNSKTFTKKDIIKSNNGANNFTLSGLNSTLTLQGTTNQISTLTAYTPSKARTLGVSTLIINGITQANSTTIDQLANGENLIVGFVGNYVSTLKILNSTSNNTTIALKSITLGDGSTNNTLDLTALSNATISETINVGAGQGLNINLKNTTLATNGWTTASSGASVINVNGDTTANSTLKGGVVVLSGLNLNATTSTSMALQNISTTIDTLTSNANATGINALTLDTTANAVSATINNLNASNLEIALGGSATNSATLNIGSGNNSFGVLDLTNDSTNNFLNNSGNLTISTLSLEGDTSLSINGGNTTIENTIGDSNAMSNSTLALTLNNGSLYAKGGLDNASASNTINLTLNNATLSLGQTSTITSLNASGNTLVDLARVNNSGTPMPKLARSVSDNNVNARTTLSATTFTGEATFKLYVSSQEADRVVFNNASGAGEGVATIALVGGNDVYDITYDASRTDKGNVMVADVSNANGQVKVVAGESMIGVNMIQATITEGETAGQYFVGQVRDLGLNQSYQEVASSALAVNYDLYLANFNSLNKRMGELRESEHSNGVWARVFGGNMSNDFGSGSKTDYVTAQAGYDYSLSIGENARNFMGIALAYGTSNTKGNTIGVNAINATTNSISLDKVNSNMIEVGLYNSYVADSGWYNDTIFKFDYIMSEFSFSTDPTRMSETNNFAMVLSDEFGYRYKFGESEKGSWYIDPQVEVAFGYFNQSDFNRAVFNGSNTFADLQARQDSILTLRSRIGASLGKKFTTDKGFASIYVGASYEYDYIEGGNSEASGRVGGTITQLDKVESNGRAVLNVGSNIELTKGARMYIDVEKSFGDKQRTFMQFNLGARYSF